jgi:hypothetical protein
MDKESFDKIVDAFETAGYEPRSYSGRAMYGAHCLGVECDNGAGLMAELAVSIAEQASDPAEVAEIMQHLTSPRGDSMGRGSILYWPSIEWMDGEEDEDGEDPHADIEVCTEVYEERHGRKPRGEGRWAFFFQGVPSTMTSGPGYSQPLFVEADFREAARAARAKAAEAGCDGVSVGT